VTWFDWLRIAAFFLAVVGLAVAAIIGFMWFLSEPMGTDQPERIVDVDNRGHTHIRMPDGSIR
jgi:hypothetical protein